MSSNSFINDRKPRPLQNEPIARPEERGQQERTPVRDLARTTRTPLEAIFQRSSYSWNEPLIDEYYQRWRKHPESVDGRWRAFFEGFELGKDVSIPDVKKEETAVPIDVNLQAKAIAMIQAYRARGHLEADFNPLQDKQTLLMLADFGIVDEDLDKVVMTAPFLQHETMTLAALQTFLKQTYCGIIGFEYDFLSDKRKRQWFSKATEAAAGKFNCCLERQRSFLETIVRAEVFENFLRTRYVGQKRFSLEGGEGLILALSNLIDLTGDVGIDTVVLGMTHRGRLNVLANLLKKPLQEIFWEFEKGAPDIGQGKGDVRYHLGHTTAIRNVAELNVNVILVPNSSHLESVCPVVAGRARALQRDRDRKRVLPVQVHGDAAIVGQGVVAETLNLCHLEGYTTGGTLHIVLNNQIGFTTTPKQGRSSRYCTDIAKSIEAPILHVHGEHPEAIAWATALALEYRQTFGEDIFINLCCYRRLGHNEADEPIFTQPELSRKARQKPLIGDLFGKTLFDSGVIDQEAVASMRRFFYGEFERVVPAQEKRSTAPIRSTEKVRTAVDSVVLQSIADRLVKCPQNFSMSEKIRRQLEEKREAFERGHGITWSFAEALALGSMLVENVPIRFSGQDCERGTFSQRHAAYYDSETEARYAPLSHLHPTQAPFSIYNSSLSEAAILGFEYGYSVDAQQSLCIWEAQFGDFLNGAQVIFDAYIASGEAKWDILSKLILLLPHGYDGQGHDHSSAYVERVLQLCAQNNLQVCQPTTPAQYFHLLRRQVFASNPLIIFTPKSLLRDSLCTSAINDFLNGTFEEVLDDPLAPEAPEKVILCTGKIYYDLFRHRQAQGIKNTAILRVEQLYPLSPKLRALLQKYGPFTPIVWCQEEPQNRGAWATIAPLLESLSGSKPSYAGRPPSPSAADASPQLHKAQQEQLLTFAFS